MCTLSSVGVTDQREMYQTSEEKTKDSRGLFIVPKPLLCLAVVA